MERVFRLQKKAVRIILKLNYRESYRASFGELGLMTLPCLYVFEVIEYCRSRCALISGRDVYQYETRGRDNLRTHQRRLKLSQHLPQQVGVRLINKLPEDIKNSNNLNQFIQNSSQTPERWLHGHSRERRPRRREGVPGGGGVTVNSNNMNGGRTDAAGRDAHDAGRGCRVVEELQPVTDLDTVQERWSRGRSRERRSRRREGVPGVGGVTVNSNNMNGGRADTAGRDAHDAGRGCRELEESQADTDLDTVQERWSRGRSRERRSRRREGVPGVGGVTERWSRGRSRERRSRRREGVPGGPRVVEESHSTDYAADNSSEHSSSVTPLTQSPRHRHIGPQPTPGQ
ncbi:hypothetical protein J6590_066335 [Homalodisca vitripennis]|nr:hypothetical protein J6590_066335 [Homalodisca vitripennis]